MALALVAVVNATPISAAVLNAQVDTIEDFINEGIVTADLDAGAWITTQHIYKPEFYGAPDPRVHAVSSDVRYRFTGMGFPTARVLHHWAAENKFLPVPGLCAALKIPSGQSVVGTLLASWYTWEYGGHPWVGIPEVTAAATFRLFLDDTAIDASQTRDIYIGSTYTGNWLHRKQHSMIYEFDTADLLEGVHNVGIRCNVATPSLVAARPGTKHILIESRSLVVDLHFK